ncbi:11028_t:CDS:2, partial [Paraglomus brasilianum]
SIVYIRVSPIETATQSQPPNHPQTTAILELFASATLKSPSIPPQHNNSATKNATYFHSPMGLPSPGSMFFPNGPRSDHFFEWVMSAATGEKTVNECLAGYVERKRRP